MSNLLYCGWSVASGLITQSILFFICRPHELGQLQQLQHFLLKTSNFTGTVHASLGNCSALTNLLMGYNNLVGGIIPIEFERLSLGTEIGFESNLQPGTGYPIPRSLWVTRSQLQILFLGGCNFSSIAPKIWSMPNLRQLSAFSNALRGEIPLEVLGNCTTLCWVSLETTWLEPSQRHSEIWRVSWLWSVW